MMMPHVWGARLHCVGARLHCVAATPLMAIQRLTRPLEVGPHVPRIQRPRPCQAPRCARVGCIMCYSPSRTPSLPENAATCRDMQRRTSRNRRLNNIAKWPHVHHYHIDDTKRNERERKTNNKRSQHMRSIRNNDNGLWKKLGADRNTNCRNRSCQTATPTTPTENTYLQNPANYLTCKQKKEESITKNLQRTCKHT